MSLRKKTKKFLKNERGQGMVEYILLLVIVLAIAGVFKEKIKSMISSKAESVGGEIGKFDGN